mmetsp:Transcript_62426/g.136485  ORF Transcript_62426/g.136485 Transcript_62426/m.136485 type:complete len:93 (-) Transcript_62426:206-484(-)
MDSLHQQLLEHPLHTNTNTNANLNNQTHEHLLVEGVNATWRLCRAQLVLRSMLEEQWPFMNSLRHQRKEREHSSMPSHHRDSTRTLSESKWR